MIEIRGKWNTAYIHTDKIDDTSIKQIYKLVNAKIYEDSNIHIMPDVHAGAGCVIGTTMTIEDYVTPNLVGVDLSCGVFTVEVPEKLAQDLELLDKTIREKVPTGFNVHENCNNGVKFVFQPFFSRVKAEPILENSNYYLRALGTLGGGNHYIEIGRGEKTNKLYLSIHSGSRKFGFDIANHYQKLAEKMNYSQLIIEKLKKEGRHSEIEGVLEDYKTPKSLAYLTGIEKENYLNDIRIADFYAHLNRKKIAITILNSFDIDISELQTYETVHNYISPSGILRKGAISANKDEIVFIPLNMRDGVIKAKGKGNPKWNYSAPHGAGRIMSRSQAKKEITFKDFESSMDGIYSTSIKKGTLDEAPMAYKKMKDITDYLGETADVIEIIKPIYNCKG